MRYGKNTFKIEYKYNNTWYFYTADISRTTSKYDFNLTEVIDMKNILGSINRFPKGVHHKFSVIISRNTVAEYNMFKVMNLINGFRFYPHNEVNVYYTVNLTKFNPSYVNGGLVSTDRLELVFETNDYQPLIVKDTVQNVSECWNMDAYSALGMMNNIYQRYGDMLNVTGLLGNCMRLNSGGANYIRIPNYEKATEWTFHTWINIPYDTDIGYFFSIGADGVANQSLSLWKRGAWTTSGGLVEVFIGGVSMGNITLQADHWHLLSIKAYSNNLYLYQDGYQRYFGAKGSTSVDYFYLGAGTGDRPFQLKIDQTVLFKTPCITNNADTLYMYNNGGGRLVDMPKFYLS